MNYCPPLMSDSKMSICQERNVLKEKICKPSRARNIDKLLLNVCFLVPYKSNTHSHPGRGREFNQLAQNPGRQAPPSLRGGVGEGRLWFQLRTVGCEAYGTLCGFVLQSTTRYCIFTLYSTSFPTPRVHNFPEDKMSVLGEQEAVEAGGGKK